MRGEYAGQDVFAEFIWWRRRVPVAGNAGVTITQSSTGEKNTADWSPEG